MIFTNAICVISVGKTSSTESSESDNELETVDDAMLSCKRIPNGTRGKMQCITPDLVSVFDRCKISDVAAVRILIAAARAFQLDPRKYIINRNSLRQARTKNRQEIAEFLKENPQVCHIK